MTVDGPAEAMTEGPILTVMWHGNRVLVFGDGSLGSGNGRTRQQRLDAVGAIANGITDAASIPGMISALRRSAVGQTHDVDARIVADVLQVWLRQRPGS